MPRSGDGKAGAKAFPAGQFRGPLEARVAFEFREWGKLQMALAGGSEHMNVLAPAGKSNTPAPSGSLPAPPVAVLAGSTASELIFGAGVVNTFTAGSLIAVDVDYQQQTGFVGSGIAAAYVNDPAAVKHDIHYVRRVTFNVGRVAEVTTTSVILAQPLWVARHQREHLRRSSWHLSIARADRSFRSGPDCSSKKSSRADGFASTIRD